MPAITGTYRPADKKYLDWAADWMRPTVWTSPRLHLSHQLRSIRKAHGSKEAQEFRNYLLWIGVYPPKRRTPTTATKGT